MRSGSDVDWMRSNVNRDRLKTNATEQRFVLSNMINQPMRHLMIFFLMTGIFLASCKKDHSVASATPSLIGQWEWVEQTNAIAVNGIPYDTLTPKSTGMTGLLSMNKDSSWSWAVNGLTVDQGTFAIDSGLTPEGYIRSLTFKGSNDQFLTFIGSENRDSMVNHSITANNDRLIISNILYVGKYTVDVFARAPTPSPSSTASPSPY